MTPRAPVLVLLGVCAGCALRSEPFASPLPADVPRLEGAILAEPGDVESVVALAVARLEAGRAEEARALLQEMDGIRPGDPAVPLLLAMTEERLGLLDTAWSRYEEYRRARLGPLAQRALDRSEIVRPAVLRTELRAALATPLPEIASGSSLSNARVVVVPFAGPGGEEGEAEAAAVASLLGSDLREVGWDLVDGAVVRILLDEMGTSPATRADLALGIEIGRRLGATRVIQGLVREATPGVVAWDVTLASLSREDPIGIDHMSVAGLDVQVPQRLSRLTVMLGDALEGVRPTEGLADQPSNRNAALLAYGQGLRAMDRGDIAAAATEFRSAADVDGGFLVAIALADRTEAILRLPPMDELVREVARIGGLQRAVSALRSAGGSSHQAALGQVGSSDRAGVSGVLGFDQIEGGAVIELTLPLPSSGP